MGVELLHYRPWRGQLRSSVYSILPIARVSLGMIFRRKLFWVLYALGSMIFLLFFFGQYLLAWAETQMGESNVSVFGIRENPARLATFFREMLGLNGTGETYRNLISYQAYIVMVVLALAGAVLIGNDFRHGSLPFYLSKPLSRWHYLLGKGLAVAVFINLMTTLPAAVLWVQFGLLYSWDEFTDKFHLLVGIFGYGMCLTVCLSLMLLAAACWLQRTVPLIMVWTTLFLFLPIVATALVEGLHFDARWRLIDIWNNLYLLGCACLPVAPEKARTDPQPAVEEAALVIGVVCLLCASYLNLRIRAVEIVR